MDTVDEILLEEWEDDTPFRDFPDDSSLISYSNNLGPGQKNPVFSEEENSFRKINNDLDYATALSLQMEFEEFEQNSLTHSEKSQASKPLSIVDEQWELIDPHPDIHALFVEYDKNFFYGKLKSVEVRWSPRMTLCAGICSYQGRHGLCSIGLSVPLLKLRPRRDLVETLLHEMIHAYLFVTENNKDRDGHGPEFLSHMHRINKEAGTKITVYHTFHAEVNLYKQHWWKCDGPCRNRSPYFGLVKRAMNRAPGPNDNWWAAHQQSCGGKYVKIKEPINYSKNKVSKRKPHSDSKCSQSHSDIRKFIRVSNPELGNKESSKPKLDIETPCIFVEKSSSPKKDHIAVTNTYEVLKKDEFIPFLGTGHKLGTSLGQSQELSNFINLKNSQSDCKKDMPSTSLGNTLSKETFSSSSSRKGLTQRGVHSSSSGKPLTKKDLHSDASGRELTKRDSPFSVPGEDLLATPKRKTSKISEISSSSNTQNLQNGHDFSTNLFSNHAKESNNTSKNDLLLTNNSNCLQESCVTGVIFANNVNTKLHCPVCSNLVKEEINSHLDKCLKDSAV